MKRLAFTVTDARSSKVIRSFRELLQKKLFQGIEIFYPYHLDEEGIARYEEDIKYLVKDLDVEIVMHLPFGKDCDLVCGYNSMMFAFFAIDFGHKFGVKKFTLHIGSTLRSDYLDKSVRSVQKLCDYAAHYGGYIMVENMPADNEVGSTLEELKYIFENVKRKNLRFIYDTGHGHVSLKNIDKEIEMIKEMMPYMCHLHISDNDSTSDKHAPIGTGNIEFEKIFKALDEYNGLYCLEILFETSEDLKKYREDLVKILDKVSK